MEGETEMGRHRDRERWRWKDTETQRRGGTETEGETETGRDRRGDRDREGQRWRGTETEGETAGGRGLAWGAQRPASRPDRGEQGPGRGASSVVLLTPTSLPTDPPSVPRPPRPRQAPPLRRPPGGSAAREQRARDFRTAPQNFKPATMKWNKNHACGEGEPADGDRRKPPREERRAEDDSWRSQGPGAPKSGLGQHRLPCRGHRQGSKLG